MEPDKRGVESAEKLSRQGVARRHWALMGKLTAAMLVPLGLFSLLFGLIQLNASGDSFLIHVIVAIVIIMSGAISWWTGPFTIFYALAIIIASYWYGLSRDERLDETDFPTLMYGLPFFALAFSCGALAFSVEYASQGVMTRSMKHYETGMIIGASASFLLTIVVPVVASIRRSRSHWGV